MGRQRKVSGVKLEGVIVHHLVYYLRASKSDACAALCMQFVFFITEKCMTARKTQGGCQVHPAYVRYSHRIYSEGCQTDEAYSYGHCSPSFKVSRWNILGKPLQILSIAFRRFSSSVQEQRAQRLCTSGPRHHFLSLPSGSGHCNRDGSTFPWTS